MRGYARYCRFSCRSPPARIPLHLRTPQLPRGSFAFDGKTFRPKEPYKDLRDRSFEIEEFQREIEGFKDVVKSPTKVYMRYQ